MTPQPSGHQATATATAQQILLSQQAAEAQRTAYARQSVDAQVVAVQRLISAQHNAAPPPPA